MAKLYVKNECVDRRDGTRYFPGQEFPGPTSEQDKEVDRLTNADCLTTDKPAEVSAPAEKAPTAAGRGRKRAG